MVAWYLSTTRIDFTPQTQAFHTAKLHTDVERDPGELCVALSFSGASFSRIQSSRRAAQAKFRTGRDLLSVEDQLTGFLLFPSALICRQR